MNRNISNTFQASIDIVDGFSTILSPISRLSSDIAASTGEVDAVESKLDHIDGNFTEAKGREHATKPPVSNTSFLHATFAPYFCENRGIELSVPKGFL